jgi:hypothetical protein
VCWLFLNNANENLKDKDEDIVKKKEEQHHIHPLCLLSTNILSADTACENVMESDEYFLGSKTSSMNEAETEAFFQELISQFKFPH